MNYVNRTAITAARLRGLERDLHLSDIQYNVVLSILFVTLSLGQPPSNMILNKVRRPSIYIGCCVVAWGLASALSGVTTNYAGMLACRFFIGLPEASFYPGAVYLLSCWYTKKELAIRTAMLFSGMDVRVANAFGALFIIEGCSTVFLGFLVMCQARLAEDAGEADQDTQVDSPLHGFRLAIGDPLVWLFSLMLFSQHLGRSIGLFFPTQPGFSTSITLCSPPWLVAGIFCVLNAWHADRTGERFWHITVWVCAMMVGFIISLCTMSIGARYFSMFLMAVGDAGCSMVLVWASNSIPRPPAKRAATIGIVNGAGSLGTLAGSYAWKSKWGPRFSQSSEISLAALFVSSIFGLVIRQRLIRMNRELDADDAAVSSGIYYCSGRLRTRS
ncbi:major facilitator superfamily domain-containing protein [Mycena filopes]|nr:major facilitator superfamily domain-containing protein [Mycena filopes]